MRSFRDITDNMSNTDILYNQKATEKRGAVLQFYHVPTISTNYTSRSTFSPSSATFKAFLTNYKDSWKVNWNQKETFGRMDSIQSYKNTQRSISVSFAVPSNSAEEGLNNFIELQKLIQMQYPVYETTAVGRRRKNINPAEYQKSFSVNSYVNRFISSPPLIYFKFMNWAAGDGGQIKKDIADYVSDSLVVVISDVSFNPDLEMGVYSGIELQFSDLDAVPKKTDIIPKVFNIDLVMTVIHNQELGWTNKDQLNNTTGQYIFGIPTDFGSTKTPISGGNGTVITEYYSVSSLYPYSTIGVTGLLGENSTTLEEFARQEKEQQNRDMIEQEKARLALDENFTKQFDLNKNGTLEPEEFDALQQTIDFAAEQNVQNKAALEELEKKKQEIYAVTGGVPNPEQAAQLEKLEKQQQEILRPVEEKIIEEKAEAAIDIAKAQAEEAKKTKGITEEQKRQVDQQVEEYAKQVNEQAKKAKEQLNSNGNTSETLSPPATQTPAQQEQQKNNPVNTGPDEFNLAEEIERKQQEDRAAVEPYLQAVDEAFGNAAKSTQQQVTDAAQTITQRQTNNSNTSDTTRGNIDNTATTTQTFSADSNSSTSAIQQNIARNESRQQDTTRSTNSTSDQALEQYSKKAEEELFKDRNSSNNNNSNTSWNFNVSDFYR